MSQRTRCGGRITRRSYCPTGAHGGALERSLFSPVSRSELNGQDQNVAVHLDGEVTVKWWHRNVAKSSYGMVCKAGSAGAFI